MRYVIDLAVFGAVFLLWMNLFESTLAALLCGLIIAGAGDTVLWDTKKN